MSLKVKIPKNIKDIAREVVLKTIFQNDIKLTKLQLKRRGISSEDLILLIRFGYIKKIVDNNNLEYYILFDG